MLISDLEGSLLSMSSAHQSLQISNESLVSSSKPSFANISVTSLLPIKQDSSKDETSTLTNYSTSEKELSNSIEKQDKQKPVNNSIFLSLLRLIISAYRSKLKK